MIEEALKNAFHDGYNAGYEDGYGNGSWPKLHAATGVKKAWRDYSQALASTNDVEQIVAWLRNTLDRRQYYDLDYIADAIEARAYRTGGES